MRSTKIVCTLGPASADPPVLARLIAAGMDVARINFSHGDYAGHAQTIARVRALAAEMGRPIAILGDLQGPKLRVGELPAAGMTLAAGQRVRLGAGGEGAIPCHYPDLPRLVQPGDRILLDDGLLELAVEATDGEGITARVVVGGALFAHKGINLPRADTRIPAITAKDEEDLAFALAQGVDWVALSFVRTADEVLRLQEMIRERARTSPWPGVVAKIEKPEAVAKIESIIAVADGIMVARGDLGIEMATEEVPLIQKEIIRLCNQAGKPVITATQMLDSMIRNPRPTRAEASDVANAVLDGTDAVMLSGETAMGRYPAAAVETMDHIVRKAEARLGRRGFTDWPVQYDAVVQAMAEAAAELAINLNAAALIVPTIFGYTARQVSHFRPGLPIVAVTPDAGVQRQLNLFWGIHPLLGERRSATDEVIAAAIAAARAQGLVREGELVVITAGAAAGSAPGATNLITVRRVEPAP
jgi:pyruvate kinase